MPKEWILNQANMRWGLTKKNKVGPVSELIRKCSPKALKDNVSARQNWLRPLTKAIHKEFEKRCHNFFYRRIT